MRSSLLENKILQIAEIKPNGIYFIRMKRTPTGPEAEGMNRYFRNLYQTTGCVFIVLGQEFEFVQPVEEHVKNIEEIVEKIMIRHSITR
jgi:hypothetical protein